MFERVGVLNFGSAAPSRRIFLMVFRDRPVRRAITRIGILSHNAQRRTTLKKTMSITPYLPQPNPSGQRVHMGQFSVKILGATGSLLSENQQRKIILSPQVTDAADCTNVRCQGQVLRIH